MEKRKRHSKRRVKRLLDLMINSIYTHKEIFLREILSNASDAIDKLCYLSLTDDKVGLNREDFAITLSIDKENRTLTVSDNGIGMSRRSWRTTWASSPPAIPSSSGRSWIRERRERRYRPVRCGLLLCLHGGGPHHRYHPEIRRGAGLAGQSDGVEGYTIEPRTRTPWAPISSCTSSPTPRRKRTNTASTSVEYPLYKLVKKYSDYIRFPIRMLMPHPQVKEGSPRG